MIETLNEMLIREPFQAFRIVITSGDKYEVTDPLMVTIGETQLFYCYPRSDQVAYIRLNQLAALETLQNAA
jgi:hypothetical protein